MQHVQIMSGGVCEEVQYHTCSSAPTVMHYSVTQPTSCFTKIQQARQKENCNHHKKIRNSRKCCQTEQIMLLLLPSKVYTGCQGSIKRSQLQCPTNLTIPHLSDEPPLGLLKYIKNVIQSKITDTPSTSTLYCTLFTHSVVFIFTKVHGKRHHTDNFDSNISLATNLNDLCPLLRKIHVLRP